MPHTTPNIPTSQPDNRKTSTINETMKAAKGNANNSFGPGIAANSTSSGNSMSLDETTQERSFWAMITRRLRFYNTPPLAWLRIPNDQKPKDKNGKYVRDPWESYDGFSYDSTPSNIMQDGFDENDIPIYKEFGIPEGVSTEGRFDRYSLYLDAIHSNKLRDIGFELPGFDSATGKWNLMYAFNKYYWLAPESRYYDGSNDLSRLVGSGYYNVRGYQKNDEWYIGHCPHYFWCYGWCEIIEDLDFDRIGHSFCVVDPRPPIQLYTGCKRREKSKTNPKEYAPIPSDPTPVNISQPPPRYGEPECLQHFIPKEHQSHGGLWGSAMGPFPAHEVNNCKALSGSIVRMYKGKGNYYLFENPNIPTQKRSYQNNIHDVIVGSPPNANETSNYYPWNIWSSAGNSILTIE